MTENEKREPNAFEIPVLTESRRYWHTRDVNGIRLFDQIATATEIAACTGAAERLGFELLDRIEVSAERPYRFISGRRRTGPMERRPYRGVRVGWPQTARGATL